MASLYEEKDLQDTAKASEMNLGQQALQKYTENFDQFDQKGYTPERVFNALYKSEMKKSGTQLDPERWAKDSGMDVFLSESTNFSKKIQQERADIKTREENEQNMGDFSRGAASGVYKVKGSLAGLGMLGASKILPGKLGEGLASWFGDSYKESMRQASLYPTKTIMSEREGEWFDFSQIKGPGDAIDWVQGTMGDLFPSMAFGLVSGGVGALVGSAAGAATKGMAASLSKKFIEGQVQKQLAKGVGREVAEKYAQTTAMRMAGGAMGQVLGTQLLETGGNFAQAVDHFSAKFEADGLDPETARLRAFDEASGTLAAVTGLAAGLVERLGGSARLLDAALGKGASEAANEIIKLAKSARLNPTALGKTLNIGRNLLREAAKQMPEEFGQEAVQEILSLANIEFTDPDFEIMSHENLRDVLGAGIAGAVGGGGTAMSTNLVTGTREALTDQKAPDVNRQIMALRLRIKNQEEILAKDPSALPGVASKLEQNRRDLEALSGYAKVEATGLSYADAAARINEASPDPDGKPFGVRQLKNMLRDKRIEKLEDGTVDPVSLATFLEGRKARAEGITDPAEIQKRVEAARASALSTKEAAAQKFDQDQATDDKALDIIKKQMDQQRLDAEKAKEAPATEVAEGATVDPTLKTKTLEAEKPTVIASPKTTVATEVKPEDPVPAKSLEEVMAENEVYENWSNVRDGSDREAFDSHVSQTLGIARNIIADNYDATPADINAYLANSKAFHNKDVREAAVKSLFAPKAPVATIDEAGGEPAGQAADLEAIANEAATSPLNDLAEPSLAQKEAGNYKKAHYSSNGLNYSIENPKGSERKGVDKDGRPWSTTMKNHYAYIKGSIGADKDHLDAFLSDTPEAGRVFVVDQVDAKTGKFDEHKAMVGFETEAEAREAYLSNYEPGWQGLGAITPMEHADFKEWALSKKTNKAIGELKKSGRKPFPQKSADIDEMPAAIDNDDSHLFDADDPSLSDGQIPNEMSEYEPGPFSLDDDPDLQDDRWQEYEDYAAMAETYLDDETTSRIKNFRAAISDVFGEDGFKKLVSANLINYFYEPGEHFGTDASNKDGVGAPITAAALYSSFEKTARYNIALEEYNEKAFVFKAFFHEVGVHHGIESFIDTVGGKGAFEQFQQSFIDLLMIEGGEKSTEFTKGGKFFGISQTKDQILKSHKDFMWAYNSVIKKYVDAQWSTPTASTLARLKDATMEERMQDIQFFHEFLGAIASNTDWTKKDYPAWIQSLVQYVRKFFERVGIDYYPTVSDVHWLVFGSIQNVLAKDNQGIEAKRLKAAKRGPAAMAAPEAKKKDVPEGVQVPMNYTHDGEKRVMRDDVLDKGVFNTFDAIWEGLRTATTRTAADIQKYKLEPGARFFSSKGGRVVEMEVISVTPLSELTEEEWSKNEGWAKEMFIEQIGTGRKDALGLPMADKQGNPLPLENYQVKFKVVKKTDNSVKAGKSIPGDPNYKPAKSEAKEGPAAYDPREERSISEQPKDSSRTAPESTFLQDLERIMAEDIARIAGDPNIKTKNQLNTPIPLDFVGPLKDGAVPFFSINAATDAQKQQERKTIDALLTEKMWQHLALDPDTRKIMQSAEKAGRLGSEYQYEAVASAIRILPRAQKMTILASMAPAQFRQMLAADQKYLESTIKHFAARMKAGDGSFLYSGDFAMFMQGAWSFLARYATALHQNKDSLATVRKLEREKLDKTFAAKDQKERKEIAREYRAKIAEERMKNAATLAKGARKLREKLNGIVFQMTNSKSDFHQQQKAFFDKEYTGLARQIEADFKAFSTVANSVYDIRKALSKGLVPYMERGSLKMLDNPNYLFMNVLERIPPKNYGNYAAYIDGVTAEIDRALDTVTGMKNMTDDAKRMYRAMFHSFVATRVYTGRAGQELKARYAKNIARMQQEDLSAVARGVMTVSQMEQVAEALHAEVDARRQISEDQRASVEEKFRLAEQIRSAGVTGTAIMGAGQKQTVVIKGVTSVEDFRTKAIALHNEITALMEESGALLGEGAKKALTFPFSTKVNAISPDTMELATSPANNEMLRQVNAALAQINADKSYQKSGKVEIRWDAVLPSTSMVKNEDGRQVHELNLIMARVPALKKEFPALAVLKDHEILLGVVGFGMRNAERGLDMNIYDNMPMALLKKLQEAGFLEVWDKKYVSPAKGFAPMKAAGKLMRRSLLSEVEYERNGRQAIFATREANLQFADGVQTGFRQLTPGVMLYDQKSKQIYLVGGRMQIQGKQPAFTLLAPTESGGVVKLDWVRDGSKPKYFALEDLASPAFQLHVVPRVWDLYSGFTEGAGFRMMDDYEFFNARQIMHHRKQVAGVAKALQNEAITRAVYVHPFTDKTGQDRLAVYDANGNESIFTVSDAAPAKISADVAFDRVIAQLGGDKGFADQVRIVTNPEIEDDKRLLAAQDAVGRALRIAQTVAKDDSFTEMEQALVAERVRDMVENMLDKTQLESSRSQTEYLVEDETVRNVVQENLYEAEDATVDQDGYSEQRSDSNRLAVVDLIDEDAFLQDILFPGEDLVAGTAARENLAGDLLLQAQNAVEEAIAERDSLLALQQKYESYLKDPDGKGISMAKLMEIRSHNKLLPAQIQDAVDAIKAASRAQEAISNIVSNITTQKDGETLESKDFKTTMALVRKRISEKVFGHSFDPARLASAYFGHFAALPKDGKVRLQAILSEKVDTFKDENGAAMSIAQAMAAGKLPSSFNGLLEAGYPDLAFYLMSAVSMDENIQASTAGEVSSLEARVAYAMAIEELPIPMIDGGTKRFGDLFSKPDQIRALLDILMSAGVLRGYHRAYVASVSTGKKKAHPWLDQKEVQKSLMWAVKKSGLSRLLRLDNVDASMSLAGAGKPLAAGDINLPLFITQIAEGEYPADIAFAEFGDTVENRRREWRGSDNFDRSKKSTNYPDQQTLYADEFAKTLDDHLVAAIADEFAHGSKTQRAVSGKVQGKSLAEALDVLAEHYDDPAKILMAVARYKLGVDDTSYGATAVDDIVSFVGVDGIKYNLITENQADANREAYPPLPEYTISGADYTLLRVVDELAPGAYGNMKITIPANGMSKTLSIDGKEGGIEFNEKAFLTDFGQALLRKLQQMHDEAISNPLMAEEMRFKIRQAVLKHIEVGTAFGDLSGILEGKFRIRPTATLHVLKEESIPSPSTLRDRAEQILKELTVFGGKAPALRFHAPGVTALTLINDPKFAKLFPASLRDRLHSFKRSEFQEAKRQLENAMGFVDTRGHLHIFVGQHATAQGTFDMDEFTRTVYHEGIGHLGLRKLLGPKYEDFLVGVFNSQLNKDKKSKATREQRMDQAEEYLAGLAEQVRHDAAAGRPTNRHIGTLLDRVAVMIIDAFHKLMKKMGIKLERGVTGFEIRNVMARAFAGSKVGGRTGVSSLFAPSMIPGENLVRYESFDEYTENSADMIMRKTTDYLRRWEMLERSALNYGHTIAHSERFMYGLRTQKSRIGSLTNYAEKYAREFEALFKGQPFDVEDVSELAHAFHALERNDVGMKAYLERKEADMRSGHARKVEAGVFATTEEMAKAEKAMENKIASRRKRWEAKQKAGTFSALSGMSDKQARAFIDATVAMGYMKQEADGSYSGKIVDAVKKLVSVNDEAMQLGVQSGMISRAAYESIGQQYKFFVPIPGYAEQALSGFEHFDFQAGNRFRIAPATSAGMSFDEDTRTIVGSTFAGLRTRIAEIGANDTNNTIFNFVLGHANAKLFQVFIEPSRFDKMIEGMIEDNIYSAERAEQLLNNKGFYRREHVGSMTRAEVKEYEALNGYIPVYQNGRLNYIKILDPGLRKGFDFLNSPAEVGRIMRALGAVNRWLIKVNTSMNPEFFIPNMARDIGSAYNTLSIRENVSGLDGRAFSKNAVKKVPDAMRVLYAKNFGKGRDSLTESQKKLWDMMTYFEDYGGKIQWAFLETPEETMNSISEAVRVIQGKGTKMENVKHFANKVEGLFKDVADVFENSTRLSVFAAAVEAGSSYEEAALMAREITVDFDRKGEFGQAINTLYMFANAGIQGTMTILRTMKNNPARAAKHLSVIVGTSVSLALLNTLAGGNGDDDEPLYFAIPQDTRNGNIILMLPGMDKGIKIPIPYGYAFFWSIGQEMVNSMLGRSGNASAGILGAFLNNFNPLETAASLGESHGWVRMLSPTIIDPVVDIGFEKTPFGTPLMPDKVYEGQPDSSRHWRSVTGPSKAIAQWLNEFGGGSAGVPGAISISPETLDLLFEQATGGLGRVITRAGGLALAPASGREIGTNDIPLVRRFATSPGSWEDRARFKSNYDEIQGVNRTMKNLRDNVALARTPELRATARRDLEAFQTENKTILGMRTQVNNVYSQIKSIDERKKALYKSGLPDNEVNPKLKVLDDQQREIFTRFNRIFYEKIG